MLAPLVLFALLIVGLGLYSGTVVRALEAAVLGKM